MNKKVINPYLDRPGMRVVNQYIQLVEEKILVTMTPTAGFTVGFTLTFTGSIDIDFKDGGGKEALTSGVEKTHLYASADTYIAEITGDLTNITQFIADSSRITFIENLKTGLLTNLSLFSNLYNGTLDLSQAPISGVVDNRFNTNLTGYIFASSGNGTMTSFRSSVCGFASLDFATPDIKISNTFQVQSNVNLLSLSFAATGNGSIGNFNVSSTNSPNIDFTVFGSSTPTLIMSSMNLTATEHDNQLINLDSTGWINGSLTIITGNTARTSASDTAYNNLIAKGWTIT